MGLIASFVLDTLGYDRVHAVTKCQKPYVMTQVACTFEPGKPVAM